jgi:hypothetical protein
MRQEVKEAVRKCMVAGIKVRARSRSCELLASSCAAFEADTCVTAVQDSLSCADVSSI